MKTIYHILFAAWCAIAFVLGSLAPLVVAAGFLDLPWTYTEPGWAWLVVVPMPLAGLIFALFSNRFTVRMLRLFTLVVAIIVVITGILTITGVWAPVAVPVLVTCLILLASLFYAAFAGEPLGALARANLFWTGIIFSVGVLAAYAEEVFIVWRAERIALSRPYCLQYASQTDAFEYKPVRSLFDINAMKMRARLLSGGSTMFRNQHHALLIVETSSDRGRTYRWSYLNQSFLADGRHEPTCVPRKNFGWNLPVW